MDTKNDTKASKFISLILRHDPSVIGATLTKDGWLDVNTLIKGIKSKYKEFALVDLERIVAEDEKQRYSFDDTKRRIRANQGHSVKVEVEMEELAPPQYLYHGTGRQNVGSIYEKGLLAGSRLQVHLSEDVATAVKVGSRHGKPYVFRVLTKSMHDDGHKFYKSANGVWLTEKVPAMYLEYFCE